MQDQGYLQVRIYKVGDILSYYPVNTIGIVDAIDGSIVVCQR